MNSHRPCLPRSAAAVTCGPLVDDKSPDNDLRGFEQAIFLQDRFIVENQRPLSLPLAPGTEIPVRADAASTSYRRWLRQKNLVFGVLP